MGERKAQETVGTGAAIPQRGSDVFPPRLSVRSCPGGPA